VHGFAAVASGPLPSLVPCPHPCCAVVRVGERALHHLVFRPRRALEPVAYDQAPATHYLVLSPFFCLLSSCPSLGEVKNRDLFNECLSSPSFLSSAAGSDHSFVFASSGF
jgi:hypothetical protein